MLIREKLPSGHIYPQITQAPINYFDFLNFFRDGQTIDDNLAAGAIASTLQANLLRAAISSGHLTKTKNMAIPDEFLADIVLTDEGAKQILAPQNKQIPTPQDKQPMESHKSDWERVSEAKLGGGGQSDVYLVRTPERTKKRIASLAAINRFTPVKTVTAEQITKANIEYVEAIREYTRPDLPSELGAMKEFNCVIMQRKVNSGWSWKSRFSSRIVPVCLSSWVRTPANAGWSLNTSRAGRWKITFWNTKAIQP